MNLFLEIVAVFVVNLAVGVCWVCGLRKFNKPFCSFEKMMWNPETFNLHSPEAVGAGALFWVVSLLSYVILGLMIVIYILFCLPVVWFGKQIQKVCK